MTEPWVRIAELEKEVEGLHTHADLVESDRDALLAVMRAGNALEIAGRNRGYGELPLMDLWLKLRDALAALPEYLRDV